MPPAFRVYLITDRSLFPGKDGLYRAVEDAVEAGVRCVQLREKDLPVRQVLDMAYRLRAITAHHGAMLFINERVDVALAAKADGVHLGAAGIPVKAARAASGGRMLIGVSAHSVAETVEAGREGADFVTLGPVYETPSKMKYGPPVGTEVLRKAAAGAGVPVFAIGGIRPDRIGEVKGCGAYGVAVISAILASGDVKSSAEEFERLMK